MTSSPKQSRILCDKPGFMRRNFKWKGKKKCSKTNTELMVYLWCFWVIINMKAHFGYQLLLQWLLTSRGGHVALLDITSTKTNPYQSSYQCPLVLMQPIVSPRPALRPATLHCLPLDFTRIPISKFVSNLTMWNRPSSHSSALIWGTVLFTVAEMPGFNLSGIVKLVKISSVWKEC